MLDDAEQPAIPGYITDDEPSAPGGVCQNQQGQQGGDQARPDVF